jgi:type II secretory pathway component PulJ
VTDIDSLASTLLEESKRFLEKAQETQESVAQHAYLHASLSLGFSALEAHINAIIDEQLERTDLSLHERAFLSERKIDLRAGVFVIQDVLQMQRIDDRIAFLWSRCSVSPPYDYQSKPWSQLKEGLKVRNSLTHPKEQPDLTIDKVTRSLSAIIEIIDTAFQRIYGKTLPAKKRGLQSVLNF